MKSKPRNLNSAPAHPWIERNPATGAQNLKMPLPPPETARQLANALSALADNLRGSTCVMGEGRTYVAGLRAVTSTDRTTADFYAFDIALLGLTATRIVNEVKSVSRVVHDLTPKAPSRIDWE